jgi:P4 family phage/plasmid primase-like protien
MENKEFREAIESIKARINCVTASKNICGLDINREGDRCKSFLHAGSNPNSVVVYNDRWWSFSDAMGGDVIDLVSLAKFDGDKGKAIRYLAQITNVDMPSSYKSDGWVEYTQNLNNQIQLWHEHLREEDYEYLHKRGINDDTINTLRLGYDERTDRIIIPMYRNGYVSYFCGRTMAPVVKGRNPKYLKPPLNEYNMNDLFGLDTLSRNKDSLIIAEGAFDYLSFYQEGYPVLSMAGGTFSKRQRQSVITYARNFKEVILTFDNDASGAMFNEKLAKELMDNRIKFKFVEIPESCKDISDYYEAGGNLDTLVANAKDGIVALATLINDLDELEAFAVNVCRFMNKISVAQLFAKLEKTGKFDPEVLKVLKAECSKMPSERFIANEVVKKHNIIYNSHIGYYEYDGMAWNIIPPDVIISYISKELGSYTSGTKCNSIIKLVRAMIVNDNIMMNQLRIINFMNGTLDLMGDEPVFREHRKEDYVDYVIEYPYDPSATSPKFDKFIYDISGEDENKAKLLQEMAGYILFNDNSMHKGFILVGEGANGKSVYLNMLMKMIGHMNVSNVELSSINQPFQAIQFSRSFLNVSADASTKIEACESVFKQITAGDIISACHKGKDFMNFRPRTKMFIACNELPHSRDVSDGYFRRMKIVRFDTQFVDHPTKPNEKPINKNLERELSEDMSAIFNWVLKGYNMIKTEKEFVKYDGEDRIMEDYEEETDTTIQFVKELEFERYSKFNFALSCSELFRIYLEWCDTNGIKYRKTKMQLMRQLKKHFPKYRPDVVPYRTSKTRGYKLNINYGKE